MTEILIRLGAFLLVATAAFLWPRDVRRYWDTWPPRARRVAMGVMPVFIANGIGILNAAYYAKPLVWTVYLVAFSYAVLIFVLLWTPRDERDN